MSMAQQFARCILTPWVRDSDGNTGSSFHLVNKSEKWSTSSFYTDANSGRATVAIPLLLRFESQQDLDAFLANNCFYPSPSSDSVEEADVKTAATIDTNDASFESATAAATNQTAQTQSNPSQTSPHISIEAKVNLTFGTGHALTAAVEGVAIISCKRLIDEQDSRFAVVLQTEVSLCVSRAKVTNAAGDADLTAKDTIDTIDISGVKINLEISAVYHEPADVAYTEDARKASVGDILESFHPGQRSSRRDRIANPRGARTRLQPALLVQVTVTHALSTHVRSIPGPHPGHTLIAVVIRHSNTHAHDLSITSMALHPRLTRVVPFAVKPTERSKNEESAQSYSSDTTSDMSQYVNWGFLDLAADPLLPLILRPNEVYSTVLTVDAVTPDGDAGSIGRRHSCLFSVTAVLGVTNATAKATHRVQRQRIVATADAIWSTRRSAVEPVDSFRVSFSLQHVRGSTASSASSIDDTSGAYLVAAVGIPLFLDVEITNLSDDLCRLQLLVENSDDSGKWKVSSELDGRNFGLAGMKIGSVDQELVAMDSALVIGDLAAHATTKTEVRLIPLKEGTLCIPNFHLINSRTERRHICVHTLKAVVA